MFGRTLEGHIDQRNFEPRTPGTSNFHSVLIKPLYRINVLIITKDCNMNKYQLQGKIKSTGVAILFWFLIGAHFAYLDKWGLQILFWLTIGGLGVWWLIINNITRVNRYVRDDFRYSRLGYGSYDAFSQRYFYGYIDIKLLRVLFSIRCLLNKDAATLIKEVYDTVDEA